MSAGQDPIGKVSARICKHMNRDHDVRVVLTQDAVAHLAMYHARLPQLPKWTKMETIDCGGMRIRYAPPSLYGPVVDESALPVQYIAFDPPLRTAMDARKRLVAMSEESEAANAQFARSTTSQDFWGAYNMENLLLALDSVFMHPATLALVCLLAVVLVAPAPSGTAQTTHGSSIVEWIHTTYAHTHFSVQPMVSMLRIPLSLFVLTITGALLVRCVQWLSCKWRNAAPMPSEPLHVLPWALHTLTSPTLPRLNSQSWGEETVVITGGARGFGAELALRLAKKGARVITLDVSKTTVKHPNLVAYHCDISRQNEVFSVTRNILYRHGAPSILINNAAVRNGHPLLDLSIGDIARVMDTNTMAHFWTLKEFLPSMVENKRGHVVTISSMMGYTGVAQMVDYVASKHATVGLHESLRFELDSIHKTPFVRTTLVTTGHLQETSMFSGIQYNAFARFFAPPISTARVAEAVIDALESQESRLVAMPWYASWTPVLRLLPSFGRDAVQSLLGADHSMTTASKAQLPGTKNQDQLE